MKIKTAIIGYGIVGKKREICINKNPHLELCAISDILFEKKAFSKNGIKYFKDYNDIFQENLDAVFICMPNYLAAPITIACIKKGINIFCEKPPARNLQELLNVQKIYEQNPNIKLKYGFNHRYHDSVQKAKEIISSKKYGEIVNIRGVYGKSKIVSIESGWRSKRDYAGGGILLDQGIHMLDMISLFIGNIIEVKSMISNSFWKQDVEDNAFALLKNEEGKIVSIHSTATQWQHKFLLEITLEKCLLVLSGILSGSKSYGEENLTLIPRVEDNNGSSTEKKYSFEQEDFSWKREVDEFADSISKNTKISNGTLEESIVVMKLIENIYSKDKEWYKNYVK